MDTVQIITLVFASISLMIALSYYALLLIPQKRLAKEKSFDSITIIIPARNEEKYIAKSIRAAIGATWTGRKEIIVIDDGSLDKTASIAESFANNITLLRHKQRGKSASVNRALEIAKGEIIAIVDGDSIIGKNSLMEMKWEIEKENVAAVTCAVLVANRKTGVCMWAHLEQLQNSLIRLIFSKAGAIITTPGPLAMYRAKELREINGFSTEGFAEDADVTIRLARRGHNIRFAKNAYTKTYMPSDAKGFFRQRFRFARGMLNLFRRHLRLGKHAIDIYAFPLLVFFYMQAVIMGTITLYQLSTGYYNYFYSQGTLMSTGVVNFMIGWFTLYGFGRWTLDMITGLSPITIVSSVAVISSLLSYPLFLIAIIRFDKKFDLWHAIPFFFLFPFWLLIMIIYIISIPEWFKKEQYNIWKKNEK
jgi:cellulose synthase/poly-beta-1,6-N-acetylglucosamine synthase-like glycosyltransferase